MTSEDSGGVIIVELAINQIQTWFQWLIRFLSLSMSLCTDFCYVMDTILFLRYIRNRISVSVLMSVNIF